MRREEEIAYHQRQLFAAVSEREREYHRDMIAWLEQAGYATKPDKAKLRRILRLVGLVP